MRLKDDVEVQIFGSKYSNFEHNFIYFMFVLIIDSSMNEFSSSQKEDEIEEYLRKKYADESIAARRFGDGGEEMSDEITQQTLLPGVKDPNLWMVKCRIGEEKATVLLLMRKFITYQFSSKRYKFERLYLFDYILLRTSKYPVAF